MHRDIRTAMYFFMPLQQILLYETHIALAALKWSFACKIRKRGERKKVFDRNLEGNPIPLKSRGKNAFYLIFIKLKLI